MLAIVYLHKSFRRIYLFTYSIYSRVFSWYLLKANNVKFGSGFSSNGVPFVDVALNGKLSIGNDFKINNGNLFNRIGRQQRCFFVVGKKAAINIGNNVGMSSSAIICYRSIIIGNNVKIGGNCVIYDTDFHSLSFVARRSKKTDFENTNSASVIIHDDVFIGAHSTILKGVEIGRCAIIGAGSVVTRNIGAFEVWAGNPAKFIRRIMKEQIEEIV